MKILIEQPKLLNILNYLYVDGIFPFAVITTKKGKLISSQSDKDEFIYRYVQFLPTNFKEISQENESLKIDVEKVKGFISLRNAKDIITIEYTSPTAPNKMLISGGGVKNNIAVVKVDEKEKNTSLPFTMTDGVPHMHGGEVPLDTHVKMDIASFKLIESYASKHGIEFYRYQLGKDKKLRVFVGDVNEIEDTSTIEPTCEIVSIGAELDTMFTKGIKEITTVFKHDVNIYLRSNFPGWFTEVSKDHRFGVTIAPYIKRE